ncbi:MAG: hypothetical protein JKX76_00125 [Colwellia sp.]|nr:hypothetical protein [Colwellia sp.]
MWPANNRKAGKISCEAVYASACKGRHPKAAKVTPAALNLAAKAYLATVKDLDFIKGTLPWLRLPGWEPFLGTTQEFYFDELTARQRGMLEDGRVPPSMMDGDMPNTAARFWLQKFGHGDAA